MSETQMLSIIALFAITISLAWIPRRRERNRLAEELMQERGLLPVEGMDDTGN